MDFPSYDAHRATICTMGDEGIGDGLADLAVAIGMSNVAWTANRAVHVPFALMSPFLVRKLWWINGTTANGNVDCGIYTEDGTLLTATGATTQTGTSVLQIVTLGTPYLLYPGSYYQALSLSSGTGTVLRATVTAVQGVALGLAQQSTAHPLPATATFAIWSGTDVPWMGFSSAAVI